VLLAQHEGQVTQLALTGGGRLVTAGTDGVFFVTALSESRQCVFISDLGIARIDYDAPSRVVVCAMLRRNRP
jgi:hypothetical protein